jgi:hypothetical protein
MLLGMENNVVFNLIDGQVSLQRDKAEKFPFVIPDSSITQVDLTKVRPFLTKELFTLLTNDKFKIPESLSFEKTFKLWKEADFLLIPEENKQKIVDQVFKKATTVGNFVDIQNSHFPRKNDYYEYKEDYFRILTIGNNRQLTSIEGIEKLSHLNPYYLSIFGNESLTSINLDPIFKHFPKLNYLYLADNELSEIHATYLPSDISLHIARNRLSKDQIEKLKSLQTLPWYKKLYNNFPSLFLLDENSGLFRISTTFIASGVLAGLIGEKITNHYYGLPADEISGKEAIFFLKAALSIYAYFTFDIFRSTSPFKSAEIKGADEQKSLNKFS